MIGREEGTDDTPPGTESEEPGGELAAAIIPDAARNPETVGPSTDPPDPAEIPADIRVTFWTLVFVIKFAIIATTLGALFVAFEGRVQLGGGLLGLGAVLFLSALYRYRRYRASSTGGDGADPAG